MSRGFITFFIATMSSVFVVFALPTFEKRSLSGRVRNDVGVILVFADLLCYL